MQGVSPICRWCLLNDLSFSSAEGYAAKGALEASGCFDGVGGGIYDGMLAVQAVAVVAG
jgi:hypothetical protein